jgi:serine protease Do
MNRYTREDELIDLFINHQLSAEEQLEFNHLLKTNVAFQKKVEQLQIIVEDLLVKEQTDNLKTALRFIENDLYKNDAAFNESLVEARKIHETKGNKKIIFIGAASALIATAFTLLALLGGGYIVKKQNNAYTELKRDVNILKGTQTAIINNLSSKNKRKGLKPSNYSASGFAISSKGYLLTSYHSIKGSDSIYITSNSGEESKAKLIAGDAKLDIAILQIENLDLLKNYQGFQLLNNTADLGEKIFTLGFPSDNMVYGEGTLSSEYGFNGDTTAYQISIPVNPGNSGAPLFDDNGRLVGIIKGKNNLADGTAYAVKSTEIVKMIDQIDNDGLKADVFSKKRIHHVKGKRTEQIKKLSDYVFQINVYNNN